MTATEQTIKDAIDGGFNYWGYTVESFPTDEFYVSAMLLTPLAWQAVGKTRGWPVIHMLNMKRGEEQSQHYWLFMQHVFIDYRADGKSIEDSLAAIS